MSTVPITSPNDAMKLLGKYMSELDREVVCIVNLRADGIPINCNFVSMGSLDECVAHPREIYKSSILSNAKSMIMIHNHPSGKLDPSKSDTMITDRMLKLSELMGIPLQDHIIVGGDNTSYFSFREKELLQFNSVRYETDFNQLEFARPAVAEETVEMAAAPRKRKCR